MSLSFLLLAAQAAASATGPPTAAEFDLAAMRSSPVSTSASRCGTQASETDVVVCGKRDLYRLPLPAEHPVGGTSRDLPGGTAALTPSGPCGIFAGERRCRNADKAEFGYGRGRDPITLLSRLAKKVGSSDAD